MFELNYGNVRFVVDRPEMIVGRAEACNIVIPSDNVSRKHAKLFLEGDVLEIEDLGSSNGTLVNGREVTRAKLKVGDVITLGSEALIVQKSAYSPKMTLADSPLARRSSLEQPDTASFQISPIVEQTERLVANAVTLSDPRVAVPEIKRTIETIASELARSSDRGRKIRLLATAEIVASWHADRSLDEWRDKIAKALGLAL